MPYLGDSHHHHPPPPTTTPTAIHHPPLPTSTHLYPRRGNVCGQDNTDIIAKCAEGGIENCGIDMTERRHLFYSSVGADGADSLDTAQKVMICANECTGLSGSIFTIFTRYFRAPRISKTEPCSSAQRTTERLCADLTIVSVFTFRPE